MALTAALNETCNSHSTKNSNIPNELEQNVVNLKISCGMGILKLILRNLKWHFVLIFPNETDES